MISYDVFYWGVYQPKLLPSYEDARLDLFKLFGQNCDAPLTFLWKLLTRPHSSFHLTSTLQGFADGLERHGRPVPMKGISVARIVTVSQAADLSSVMRSREWSEYARKTVENSLVSDETRMRFNRMQRSVHPLVAAAQSFVKLANRGVPGKVLAILMMNLRSYLLMRLWFELHGRFHPTFEGIEHLRNQGAAILWKEGGQIIGVMADPPANDAANASIT